MIELALLPLVMAYTMMAVAIAPFALAAGLYAIGRAVRVRWARRYAPRHTAGLTPSTPLDVGSA